MLVIQVLVAFCILLFGRVLFYSFVRKDSFFVLILRYGGYIGITILLHFFTTNFITWLWIIGLPLLGLLFHFIFVRKNGFKFLKPGKKYDDYRGWK